MQPCNIAFISKFQFPFSVCPSDIQNLMQTLVAILSSFLPFCNTIVYFSVGYIYIDSSLFRGRYIIRKSKF